MHRKTHLEPAFFITRAVVGVPIRIRIKECHSEYFAVSVGEIHPVGDRYSQSDFLSVGTDPILFVPRLFCRHILLLHEQFILMFLAEIALFFFSVIGQLDGSFAVFRFDRIRVNMFSGAVSPRGYQNLQAVSVRDTQCNTHCGLKPCIYLRSFFVNNRFGFASSRYFLIISYLFRLIIDIFLVIRFSQFHGTFKTCVVSRKQNAGNIHLQRIAVKQYLLAVRLHKPFQRIGTYQQPSDRVGKSIPDFQHFTHNSHLSTLSLFAVRTHFCFQTHTACFWLCLVPYTLILHRHSRLCPPVSLSYSPNL